jgi:hypothetical protein
VSWFRKIRRISIFGNEVEFDHTAGETAPAASPPSKSGETAASTAEHASDVPPSSPRSSRAITCRPADPTPDSFTVFGVVVGTLGSNLGIRVENEKELREFWKAHKIDTNMEWAGKGPPVFTVGRRADIEMCKPDDEVKMTIKVDGRKNGTRGVRTIDFDVLRRA